MSRLNVIQTLKEDKAGLRKPVMRPPRPEKMGGEWYLVSGAWYLVLGAWCFGTNTFKEQRTKN
ncbi:MAG TPA: hypothetical protein PLS70_08680, partial [Acidobacteriota bacterium]|nr:hypothetical protein [Acidobacteriota bacterium]